MENWEPVCVFTFLLKKGKSIILWKFLFVLEIHLKICSCYRGVNCVLLGTGQFSSWKRRPVLDHKARNFPLKPRMGLLWPVLKEGFWCFLYRILRKSIVFSSNFKKNSKNCPLFWYFFASLFSNLVKLASYLLEEPLFQKRYVK